MGCQDGQEEREADLKMASGESKHCHGDLECGGAGQRARTTGKGTVAQGELGQKQGQIRQGPAVRLKDFGFYSKSHGKPRKGFRGGRCRRRRAEARSDLATIGSDWLAVWGVGYVG